MVHRVRVLFSLAYSRLLKIVLLNPVMLGIIASMFATGLVIGFLLKLTTPRTIALAAFLASSIVVVIALLTSPVYYGIEDGYIIIKCMGSYKIPIDEARITLTGYEEVKPVFRIMGINIPGHLAVGKYKLAIGETGIVLIYRHSREALVISYDDIVFVASHPGVKRAYQELIESKEPVSRPKPRR